ncbi:hypothetical protein PVK06_020942 [Gossypium arboreum]|uniref:Uncharacterized protein n=1 Tax=Gossypium arboreum TaxID=29729 RepID=A0ABR0PNP6_GOSAR|nr:hypothetical protein PVK06_020942 [Gossypium arboreum]
MRGFIRASEGGLSTSPKMEVTPTVVPKTQVAIEGHVCISAEHTSYNLGSSLRSMDVSVNGSWQSCEPLEATYDVFSFKLSSEEIASVKNDLKVVEMRNAMFSMKGLKALGVDGIQLIFYQKEFGCG